jgi:hypothetical protein
MSETTSRDQELAHTAKTVFFGIDSDACPIIVDISTLALVEAAPSLSDYGDSTGEAGCIWAFEAEHGYAAILVYHVHSGKYVGRFSYCGNAIEGTTEQSALLIEKLPESDKMLVAEWAQAFREGGMENVWQFEADRMASERAAKPF